MNLKPHNKLAILCLTASMAFAGATYALKSDDAKDIQIEGNRANFDIQTGHGQLTGHIIAIQGSKKLTGDKATLVRNKAGKIEHITVFGEPAHYEYLPNLKDPKVVATASKMRYQPKSGILTLTGSAIVTQGKNTFKGETLTFNNKTSMVESPKSHKGRSKIILNPPEGGFNTPSHSE